MPQRKNIKKPLNKVDNVPYGRAAHTGEPRTFAKTTLQHHSLTNTSLITLIKRVKGSLGTAYN
jgi:hypothetical protein